MHDILKLLIICIVILINTTVHICKIEGKYNVIRFHVKKIVYYWNLSKKMYYRIK